MKTAALIGNPVNHSVAPVLHEYLARWKHLEFRYLKIAIPEDELSDHLHAMATLRLAGFNVTIPYKQTVIDLLDTVDEVATQTGAVNTVVIDADRRLHGTNTDWVGITGGLQRVGHPATVGAEAEAVILGSGGAARAALYALRSLGYRRISVHYEVPLDDKTRSLMADTATLDGVELLDYSTVRSSIQRASVVCNMSSAGMHGNDPAPFDLALIDNLDLRDKYFFDAVFNPLETPFLAAGKAGGATCVDGLWMMIFQGIPAFERWTAESINLTPGELEELHTILSHALKHQH